MKVILLGNYEPDGQESMLRYGDMLSRSLAAAGVEVETCSPKPYARKLVRGDSHRGLPKWLGYLDKYVLFRQQLRAIRRRVRNQPDTVVHIVDHSNAVYVPALRGLPTVVTCHDLLAVRGALGEDTACRASGTGRVLQRYILNGLNRASAVACVSEFTLADLRRLLPAKPAGESAIVPSGMHYPYRQIDRATCGQRLQAFPTLDLSRPFIVHVGSNLPRKNKPAILKAFARLAGSVADQLVLAGPPLPGELESLAQELGLRSRIVVIEKPTNPQLEALYSSAWALVFPSLGEGFGWPIIEAQSCGCPVVCSNTSALPEVAGAGAVLVDPLDIEALAAGIGHLSDPALRQKLISLGFANARRFSSETMAQTYLGLYTRLLGR